MDTGFGGGGYMQDAGGFGSPMTDSQEKKVSNLKYFLNDLTSLSKLLKQTCVKCVLFL